MSRSSPRAVAAIARLPQRGPGRPRGPSQAPQLRERLVAEASALYAAGGYAGTSFGTLAQRTGLNKATLFHYFANKGALVEAVFQALGERLEAAALGWFEAPPASYARRLDRLVASLVDFYGADPLNARILCHGLLETHRLVSAASAEGEVPPIFTYFVRRFVDFIAGGIEAGEFVPQRPTAAIMSIGGVILFEFMLPAEARRSYGNATGIEARKQEMMAFIRRALVRPRSRLRRR